MVKKINAILAVITAILGLGHIIGHGVYLLGLIPMNVNGVIIGKVLLIIFSLHAILSMGIMFLSKGNGMAYPKLNVSTVAQRISAILLLILIYYHANNYNQLPVNAGVVRIITESLFIIVFNSHFMNSLDKALITLGINNKVLIIIIRIVSILAVIFALVAIFISNIKAM